MKLRGIQIVLSVIAIMLICIALFFTLSKPNNPSPDDTRGPQVLTERQVPSDWKEYTNEKYGFEFKHPNDLGYLSRDPMNDLYESYEWSTQSGGVVLGNENKIIFLLDASPSNKPIVLRDFLENPDRYNVNNITINGATFKEYSVKNGIYNGYNKAYILDNDNQFIAIRFVETPLASQILSTFKVLE